jgi:hypothetical protein
MIDQPQMISGSIMQAMSWEQIGNSHIKSQSLDREVQGTDFSNTAMSNFQVGSHLTGQPDTASIDVGSIDQCWGLGAFASQGSAPGTAGFSVAVIRTGANAAQGFQANDFGLVDIKNNSTTVPFLKCPASDVATLPAFGAMSRWGPAPNSSDYVSGVWYRAAASCTAGDLLMDNGAGKARPYDASVGTIPHWPVGFCFVTRASGDMVEVVTSGQIGSKVASGSTITAGSLLKPDASNAGGVVNASSWSDGPIVGMAIEAKTGPGFVETLVGSGF